MEKTPLYGTAYDNFINSLNSDKTKQDYTWYLQQYLQYQNIADNLDDLLTKDVKTIKYSIKDYLIYLRDIKKVSYSYRRNTRSSLHIFFEMNEFELPWIWISRFLGKNETVRKDREYTREEISKMLDYCTNVKYKALILLLCSSGPRIGAIPGLRIGDLGKIPDCEILKVTYYAGTRDEYYSFCTPECYRYITQYLNDRKNTRREILTPESPLFIKDKTGKALTQGGLKSVLRYVAIRSGVVKHAKLKDDKSDNGRHRNDVRILHGHRKFFNTTLMNTDGIEYIFKELLMGHSVKLDDSYYGKFSRKSQEKALSEYLKAVDNLTINEENRLKIKVKELSEKQSEIELMKERHEQEMKLVQEKMNQIMSMIQQNPVLAHVKPETLVQKRLEG